MMRLSLKLVVSREPGSSIAGKRGCLVGLAEALRLTSLKVQEPISKRRLPMIEEKSSGAFDHSVEANVVNPVPGNRDAFAIILESVTQHIASSAKGTGLTGGPLLDAVSEVVAVAARSVVETGGDLVPGTKAIIMGVVRGAGARNEVALKILSHAAKVVIHHTADRNGNLAAAIKGMILGAIASARTMGVDTAPAASAAAQGALEGAAEAGSVTVERVLGALKEPIGGNPVVLPEPLAT
jgi:hypothetical protein